MNCALLQRSQSRRRGEAQKCGSTQTLFASILRFRWTFGCSGGSDGLCWTPASFWRGKCRDYRDAQTNEAHDGRWDHSNAIKKTRTEPSVTDLGDRKVLGEAKAKKVGKPHRTRCQNGGQTHRTRRPLDKPADSERVLKRLCFHVAAASALLAIA